MGNVRDARLYGDGYRAYIRRAVPEWYASGWTLERCAREAGISYTTARRMVIAAGVPIRHGGWKWEKNISTEKEQLREKATDC